MKPFYFCTSVLLFFFVNLSNCLAQTAGITSGAIYTIKSESNNKLLNVSNASMDNSANVDCWTNTKSDAQKWVVTRIGNSIYTFTNIASGKALHIASTPSDLVNVNQYANTKGNDVKWIVKEVGKGFYCLKSAANPNFVLNVDTGSIADGANINLSHSSSSNAQKWLFHRESPQDAAPTATIADKLFEAWYTQYNLEKGKGFWGMAEMMEIVLDAYEVTNNNKYKNMFNTLYKNFILNNKSDWMYNKYNDDITWAVLFCVRGYLLTGNKTYLEKGKDQFDKMYSRASTSSFDGGLIWYETKSSKNACINGPAMVACCYLAQATGDKTYYDKAIALYKWSKLYLFNPYTGKVNDNIDLNKKTGQINISTWSSTYNQGTYLAAAAMLYKYTKETSYLSEAEKIAQYTRDSMYKFQVMNNEDGGNDLPGFKGIFARYARKYAIETNKTDLNEWLLLNAKIAYNNRNSHDLIQTKWGTRTNEAKPESDFGSSTAVSLLINSLFLIH